jgi:transposase InsO family protein
VDRFPAERAPQSVRGHRPRHSARVFIRIFKARTAANARSFLRDLQRAYPIRIRIILTDNGKEFTDRLFGLRRRAATGAHAFDRLCAKLRIEHRLPPPASPQTNGIVERFNGRIEEVLQSYPFRSGEELETTLHRSVRLCNQQLPQSALGGRSPLQAMKDWHEHKPQLFRKQPYDLPGCDRMPSPSAFASTPRVWHIAMPSGESGIHPISEDRR